MEHKSCYLLLKRALIRYRLGTPSTADGGIDNILQLLSTAVI